MEIKFTASTQLAIQWVNRNLLHPGTGVGWERPCWVNFTWFTRIHGSPIRPCQDEELSARLLRGSDEKLVERTITFYLGNDKVVRLHMLGLEVCYDDRTYTSWTIQTIGYRPHWHSGGDMSQWIQRKLMVTSFTGLPSLAAPEG